MPDRTPRACKNNGTSLRRRFYDTSGRRCKYRERPGVDTTRKCALGCGKCAFIVEQVGVMSKNLCSARFVRCAVCGKSVSTMYVKYGRVAGYGGESDVRQVALHSL